MADVGDDLRAGTGMVRLSASPGNRRYSARPVRRPGRFRFGVNSPAFRGWNARCLGLLHLAIALLRGCAGPGDVVDDEAALVHVRQEIAFQPGVSSGGGGDQKRRDPQHEPAKIQCLNTTTSSYRPMRAAGESRLGDRIESAAGRINQAAKVGVSGRARTRAGEQCRRPWSGLRARKKTPATPSECQRDEDDDRRQGRADQRKGFRRTAI